MPRLLISSTGRDENRPHRSSCADYPRVTLARAVAAHHRSGEQVVVFLRRAQDVQIDPAKESHETMEGQALVKGRKQTWCLKTSVTVADSISTSRNIQTMLSIDEN
jgi:hypothetical protein